MDCYSATKLISKLEAEKEMREEQIHDADGGSKNHDTMA